jgi:hypothetical protein
MATTNINVLLGVPQSLLDSIDMAASELDMSRAAFMRECFQRNLKYYNAHERGAILLLREQASAKFGGNEATR